MQKTIYILGAMIVIGGVVYVVGGQPAIAPEPASDVIQDRNVAAEPAVETSSNAMVTYHNDVQGYLASPVGDGPFPAVVLIHEWWGLNNNIKSLADDFAEQGYVALAVDLYGGELASTPEQAGALAGSVRENVDSAFANLESATSYLAQLPQVDEERLASVGWCFGGQWAYNMAVNNMNIDASVMYYGQFSLEDDLSMMRADILGHFGEEDALIAIDEVEQFEAKLNTTNGDHSVFIYPNAGHAFANEEREDAYNQAAAELAWERTMKFLAREVQ